MKHFYRIYEGNADMIKQAALFLKEGIDTGEFCFWAVPKSIYKENVFTRLEPYINLIDHYAARDQIRAVSAHEWYIPGGEFIIGDIVRKWQGLYEGVMSKGFTGLRVVGDASWAKEEDWEKLIEYENLVNESVKDVNITALCLFNARNIKSVVHISDIIKTHEACFSA
ncbi:MAG: MEDS domain-containing protein [Candidatus Omnitrophota bacterium]